MLLLRSETQLSERMTGIVRSFNTKRGFGFIVPKDGSTEVFVHYQDIDKAGFKSLGIGESVEFDLVFDDLQRRRASKVTGPNGAPILGFFPMRNNAIQYGKDQRQNGGYSQQGGGYQQQGGQHYAQQDDF